MKPTADNPPEATPYAPGAPFTSEKTTRIFIPAILMHFGAAAGRAGIEPAYHIVARDFKS